MPTLDSWQFTFVNFPVSSLSLVYVVGSLYFLGLVFDILVVLGGFVGECLVELPRLAAYGANLLGGLVGIALFTSLAFLDMPAWIRQAFGSVLLVPFPTRLPIARAARVWSQR